MTVWVSLARLVAVPCFLFTYYCKKILLIISLNKPFGCSFEYPQQMFWLRMRNEKKNSVMHSYLKAYHPSPCNFSYTYISGPEVTKKSSCWTQQSMNLQLLIKSKIPTNEEVSCFKPLRCCIYHANKCLNANNCWHFNIYEQDKFRAQLSWAWKKFYILGTWTTLYIKK